MSFHDTETYANMSTFVPAFQHMHMRVPLCFHESIFVNYRVLTSVTKRMLLS